MEPGPVRLRIVTDFTPQLAAEAAELYREAGFIGPEEPADFIIPAWRGSTLVAGAFAGESLIGMARAISDGVSDAYIQDVAVSCRYRRRGLGAGLIRLLTARLSERGIDWIGLVGVPGSEAFYASLGGQAQPGHTLWRLPAHRES